MSRRSNRRDFLKQTSLAGLGFWAAGGLALADGKSANEKLNIACIGVGGKGSSDTSHAAEVGNVVAMCDIDDNTLHGKLDQLKRHGKVKDVKTYNDFRKLLDEMGNQIDAVTVSTPDHTHAQAAIRAMRMGKHVYCQKPLTHTVWEARLMRQTAREHKLCTQMGNQGTASSGLRKGVEIIRSGAIGPVHEVHVWTNRPIWPQAPEVTAPPRSTPVPKHIHWDLWLTGAPFRPYSGVIMNNGHPPYHDFNWRGWWDFGTGALGDMACHTANLAYMALKLGLPTTIEAESGPVNPQTYVGWARIKYSYPARGDMPPVTFYWYEGHRDGKKLLPPAELAHGMRYSDSGSLMVGEKGVLFSPNDYGERYHLLPKEKFEGYKDPEKTLPRNPDGDGNTDLGMKKEWVQAIKEGKPHIALSNFDYSSHLTEAMILGNVAVRIGQRIEYDPHTGKVTNEPEANRFIHLEYRKGWDL
ncbi:MAG TPA: Gfo/Idh/MocA family oxidoreductase [Gemmataceae bacterium]|nr:Gfo/Idh/MocA family oxidoreductase [Gemmataceae bacterium]